MTEIRTPEDLDALPVGSVVLDADYDVMHKVWGVPRDEADYWAHVGSEHPSGVRLPAAVLRPLPDAPAAEDREALVLTARDLQAVGYTCECQVGGVDAASIDADYLHEVGRRIERHLAARQPAPTFTPAQRHAAEQDEALFRIATRAGFGTGEVIDHVLRALGAGVQEQPAPTVSAQTCTFCDEPRDDLSVGSDGTTTACQDCAAEGEVPRG